MYIVSIFYLVAQAVSILKSAKKPVALIGSQATLPPISADDLRNVLEVWKIFITLTFVFDKHMRWKGIDSESSTFKHN